MGLQRVGHDWVTKHTGKPLQRPQARNALLLIRPHAIMAILFSHPS